MSISGCKVYDSDVAVRAEDKIENLKIDRLGIGPGVKRTIVSAGGGTGPGFEFSELAVAPLEK